MLNFRNKAFWQVSVAAAIAVTMSGCVMHDVEDQEGEDLVDDEAEAQEEVGEVSSAYTANMGCTTSGGGTWRVLRMCVSISSNGVGTFTITKTDGTNFATAGTMSLKVGTYEPWGVNHGTSTLNGGGIVAGFSMGDVFSQWGNFPKDYYARWESQSGGYSWVGPIRISQ